MKKLISLMLALMLVFSLATVAMADGGDTTWDGSYAASAATSFTIKKVYNSDETFAPTETLHFTVAQDGNDNPDGTMITVGYAKNDVYGYVNVNGLETTITVNVPSYSKAGVYKYTIKEDAGNTAGVTTYDTGKTIHVQVLVEYDNANHRLVIGNPKASGQNGITYFIEKNSDGTKTDTFANVFQTNDFTVAKDVTGNMANETDTFEIVVTLTAPAGKVVGTPIQVAGESVAASNWTKNEATNTYSYTKILTISERSGAFTFADIPYGVAVNVAENTAAEKLNGYTAKGYSLNGTRTADTATNVEFTIDDDTAHTDVVVVHNEKATNVNTGITLDSLPFVLILAVCAGAVVLFVIKRRNSAEF